MIRRSKVIRGVKAFAVGASTIFDMSPARCNWPTPFFVDGQSLHSDWRHLTGDLLEALKSGDPEVQEVVAQLAYQFVGPLPPPAMLRQYAESFPDGAERIVSNWEAESQHRRGLERNGQWIAAGNRRRSRLRGTGTTRGGRSDRGGDYGWYSSDRGCQSSKGLEKKLVSS